MERLRYGNRPVVGLYTIGLNAYWAQFPGLRERLINYGKSIEGRLSKIADIKNYGLVDSEHVARMAGEWFNAQNVDIIFLHCGTYCTSASVLPIHQICKAPVVVLNLQPSIKLNYDKCDTGEWLANCGACVAPEIANSFHRSGIPFRIINGLLGLESTLQCSTADETTFKRPEAKKAWEEITEWTIAAGIKHSLRNCRFGFLGGNYCGMLDLYSDFTMLQAQTGMHVEIVEMCDLDRCLQSATKAEINAKMREINSMFEISGDSPTDPNVKQPTKEQLDWSAKVAAAQEKLVSEYGLDALAYYYHSSDGNPYEELQAGFIVGHSLLTAKGVPCAGEADLKTALAMKICDLLGAGGSFCEIVAVDYDAGTILIGHDGPFHISISNGRPILRGMGVYHGKKGTGISVEAKVRSGDITTLNVTQSSDGKLKFIISEATATKGQIMTIGNTQTHARFKTDPDTHMTKWFSQYPTHHFALSVGHNAGIFKKVAELLGIETVEL